MLAATAIFHTAMTAALYSDVLFMSVAIASKQVYSVEV